MVLQDVSRLGSVLSEVDPDGPLEAALLLKRTGVVLEAWTRHPAAGEIVPIMAATMMASIESVCSALGSSVPETVSVEADGCRIFGTQVEPNALLVLVGRRDAGEGYLRHMARRILSKVNGGIGTARGRKTDILPRF